MIDKAEVVELRQTEVFAAWLARLRDERARAAVAERLRRFALGLRGDVSSVGAGVCEARIHVGPGYRVYFTERGASLVLLLCGGDKGSQARDIRRARKMAAEIDE